MATYGLGGQVLRFAFKPQTAIYAANNSCRREAVLS